jgi:hypothetical protein
LRHPLQPCQGCRPSTLATTALVPRVPELWRHPLQPCQGCRPSTLATTALVPRVPLDLRGNGIGAKAAGCLLPVLVKLLSLRKVWLQRNSIEDNRVLSRVRAAMQPHVVPQQAHAELEQVIQEPAAFITRVYATAANDAPDGMTRPVSISPGRPAEGSAALNQQQLEASSPHTRTYSEATRTAFAVSAVKPTVMGHFSAAHSGVRRWWHLTVVRPHTDDTEVCF